MLRINQFIYIPMENNCECKKPVESFCLEDWDLLYDLFTTQHINQNNELVYVEVEAEDYLEIINDFDLDNVSDIDIVIVNYLNEWFKSNGVFMADIY